ncbi:exocyst complex component Sec10-domain-containing protein [Limtongia smithiae]|uniref:exocyst complex component Sec10-domain-containing protein n=1 Tax=Limtongia smithiae TaxID=1125753 RepID=UPI0034CF755B
MYSNPAAAASVVSQHHYQPPQQPLPPQPGDYRPSSPSQGTIVSDIASLGNDGDRDLSLDDARQFVGFLSESLVRVGQLSSKIEIPQYAKELMSVLIDVLGTSYVEVALDHLADRVQSEKATDQLAENLESTIIIATDILQLISNTTNNLLIGLASDSSSVCKEMSELLADYGARIDSKIRALEDMQAANPAKRRWDRLTREKITKFTSSKA